MTLTAPEHLRGRMSHHRPDLLAERAEWIRSVTRQGYNGTQISVALGISYGAANIAINRAGCKRPRQNYCGYLRAQGLRIGSPGEAIDGMTPAGRTCLADDAARLRKPMAAVLSEFYDRYRVLMMEAAE